MNRRNGLGDVVLYNQLLLEDVCRKTAAVVHCNNRDFWIATKKFKSDLFYSWLITPAGISSNPVLSHSGMYLDTFSNGSDNQRTGTFRFASDGSKFITYHAGDLLGGIQTNNGYVEMGRFDPSNGTFSNIFRIPTLPFADSVNFPVYGPHVVEFSPDNQLAYIGIQHFLPDASDSSRIIQYDLTNFDSIHTVTSALVVYNSNHKLGPSATGPNGKIYIGDIILPTITVIENPNLRGIACNTHPFNLSFPYPSHMNRGMPQFVASYYDPVYQHANMNIDTNCNSLTRNFYINSSRGVDSLKWDFGDPGSGNQNSSRTPSASHLFTRNGRYLITLHVFKHTPCINITDTVQQWIIVGSNPELLGADTSICSGTQFKIGLNLQGMTYSWQDGYMDSVRWITNPGIYKLQLNYWGCSYTDSIRVDSTALPYFSLGPDQIVCMNQPVTLLPNSNFTNAAFMWNDGSTQHQRTIQQDGTYWLQLLTTSGCKWADTISVQYKQLPTFELGPDITICEDSTVLIGSVVAGVSDYLWNTGSNASQILADRAGWYSCIISKDGCSYKDSLQILTKPNPHADLGVDRTVCSPNTVLLSATHPGATYQWQDQSITDKYLATKTGIYSVRVNLNGCIQSDTVHLEFYRKPQFALPEALSICTGRTITLTTSVDADWILSWENGYSSIPRTVEFPGMYTLTASNSCGTFTASTNVVTGNCGFYLPGAFSPNSDGRNDLFKIQGGTDFTYFNLSIYNRYGQLLFGTNQLDEGWDGTLKGTQQPSGTYIYLLTYQTAGLKTRIHKTGSVVLIR